MQCMVLAYDFCVSGTWTASKKRKKRGKYAKCVELTCQSLQLNHVILYIHLCIYERMPWNCSAGCKVGKSIKG